MCRLGAPSQLWEVRHQTHNLIVHQFDPVGALENDLTALLALNTRTAGYLSVEAFDNSHLFRYLQVGHALENDLAALRVLHARCIDTAALYPHPKVSWKADELRLRLFHSLVTLSEAGGISFHIGHSPTTPR